MIYFLPSFRQAGSTGEPGMEQPAGKKRKPVPMLSVCAEQATCGVSASTAENYRTAVRSFIRFSGGTDVPLSVFNADNVRSYERWLQDRGVCPNTSSCYMRSLPACHLQQSRHETPREGQRAVQRRVHGQR